MFDDETFSSTVISGLTITGGHVNDNGGGVRNYYGTLTLINVSISGNSVPTDSSYGGGVFTRGGSTTLIDCTVSGNSASRGGGLANSLGRVSLTNCTLSNNSATDVGGGLFQLGDPPYVSTLTNCTVSGNNHGLYDFSNYAASSRC